MHNFQLRLASARKTGLLPVSKTPKERGVTVAQAARDLGVHGTVLRRWVQDVVDATQAFPGHGQMKPEQAELVRIRREVLKLKAERDILPPPVYFAKEAL